MHPLVRDLYKRFLVMGKSFPPRDDLGLDGLTYVKTRVKKAFQATPARNEAELKRAVAKGRKIVYKTWDLAALKKYRTMKSRYS
jgi:hypothetical protein